MKRHAAAFLLLAGLAGCTTPEKAPMTGHYGPRGTPAEVPGMMGPTGEPIAPVTTRGAAPDAAVKRGDYRGPAMGGIKQVSDGMGLMGKKTREGYVATGDDGVPGYYPPRGILPVPAMGPYGAVAAIGAMQGGMAYPGGGRTSIRFSADKDKDMTVTWYGPSGWTEPLTTPSSYNFPQGGIYRLKLSNIPGHAGKDLYPTLEVTPATLKTSTYLARN